MRVSRLALIPVLLFTACTEEPVAPDAGFIQAAKGGNKGKPGGGGDPSVTITETDLGTLDGRSSSVARSVVSDVRVVGGSGGGDGAFYWTPGGGMVELTHPLDPNGSILWTKAYDINDGGQIIGRQLFLHTSDPALNGLQALFWNSSGALGIVLPTVARSSAATAINNNGQVVGDSFDHPGDPDGPHAHAMLWTVDGNGTVTSTRDLHEETFKTLGFINSVAEGINDGGQVVGRAYDGIRERAFLWDAGVVTLLDGAVEAGFLSFAYGINNADPVQIVGAAHDESGKSRRALLWTVLADRTVLTEELPPLAGFDHSWTTNLNDDGEVVGNSSPKTSGQEVHATLWTFAPNTADRIVVDLGMGGANGIDNASPAGLTRAVGFTTITTGKGRKKRTNNRAILWEVVPIIP